MIRISRIEIDNFKSLVDFSIDLPKFSAVIGLNGSGKSTLLQAIDFLSQLSLGGMKEWFAERKWKPSDVKSKLSPKKNIEFRLEFSNDDDNLVGVWEGSYNPSKNRCFKEKFESPTDWIHVTKDTLDIGGQDPVAITFEYEGSIVSQLKTDLVPLTIRNTLALIKNVQSLDLLSPEWLRQRTRESSGTLGLGGQNLASFVHEMKEQHRLELAHKLMQIYPRLSALLSKPLRSGWKQIDIQEEFQSNGSSVKMTTEARHVNDGMLRLIAILAELASEHQFLLFDEIENGINPELVEFLLASMTGSNKQVLVTTHSPMILNYLEDDVARKGVLYLYKDQQGHTHSIPFFSIPSLAEKLSVMGPGEAFVDTNLVQLANEIAAIAEEQ